MGQALYRKHRPKSLQDVVGQEHITDTLTKALSSGRVSHAYLFSGPRGVGKTSIARILAHELNGFAYTDDSTELDIIEIDAASNRRIDEIRELRDKVYIAPSIGKYKVYIIDEVHMLTREAFNALLKTLEEPPAHVVFILATTEAHKLPETIISRTQHYTFKAVGPSKVTAHLKHIAEQEDVKIDDEALALLAAHGKGSFRDSISVLDQVRGSAGNESVAITAGDVRQLLGIAPESAITELLATLASGAEPSVILHQLTVLSEQGLQAASIANQLAGRLRYSLLDNKPLLPLLTTLQLLAQLIEVGASYNPERLLEISLLHAIAPAQATPVVPVTAAATVPAVQAPAPKITPPVKPPAANPAPVVASAQVIEPVKPVVMPQLPSTPTGIVLDAKVWPQLIENIKRQYNTIYGVLRMATPVFSENCVELQFKFAFHQKRLNEVKNKQIIADFIKQITGTDVEVLCTYNADAPAGGAAAVIAGEPALTGTNPVSAISDIFGGAEVL